MSSYYSARSSPRSYYSARSSPRSAPKPKIPMNRVSRQVLSNYLNTNALINLSRTHRPMRQTLRPYVKAKMRKNRIPTTNELSRRKSNLRMRPPTLSRQHRRTMNNANGRALNMLRSNLGYYNALNSSRRR
jgi:hypothetical protein